MNDPKPRKPLFDRLKGALEEGIEFAQGKRQLRATDLKTPPLQQSIPSPCRIREELVRAVLLDLLGTAHGSEEELDERNVRDRYLVGMLAPKRQELSPEEFDELAQGGVGSGEDGIPDFTAPQARTMF